MAICRSVRLDVPGYYSAKLNATSVPQQSENSLEALLGGDWLNDVRGLHVKSWPGGDTHAPILANSCPIFSGGRTK